MYIYIRRHHPVRGPENIINRSGPRQEFTPIRWKNIVNRCCCCCCWLAKWSLRPVPQCVCPLSRRVPPKVRSHSRAPHCKCIIITTHQTQHTHTHTLVCVVCEQKARVRYFFFVCAIRRNLASLARPDCFIYIWLGSPLDRAHDMRCF